MSSDLHRGCPSSTTFTSFEEINQDIGPMNLYSRAKLAQILTVRALVRRMENNEPGFQGNKQTGPWVNATHPGGVRTDQQQQAIDAYGTKGKIGVMAIKPFLKDPVDEGCRSGLFAATSDDVVKEGIQGQYVGLNTHHFFAAGYSSFVSDLYVPQIIPARKVTDPSKQAKDVALEENLWRLSEEILKEKLGSLPYA